MTGRSHLIPNLTTEIRPQRNECSIEILSAAVFCQLRLPGVRYHL